MHRSRLAAFVIDNKVADLEQANRFWEQALGYTCRRYDEDSSERYSHLEAPEGQPQLLLQKVEHESRIHLDIETDDIEAEVKRLTALGASIGARFEHWVVMQAPTGQRFCVVKPQRPDFPTAPDVNEWP